VNPGELLRQYEEVLEMQQKCGDAFEDFFDEEQEQYVRIVIS